MNRKEYERDLAERQRKHLEQLRQSSEHAWRPCLHDSCPTCAGTGVNKFGGSCVHGISCPCPKCSPC